jgi:DNA-binding PadR family transcriptional regulator
MSSEPTDVTETTGASDVLGFEISLLAFVANKYEPDATALLEDMNGWYDADFGYQRVYSTLERFNDRGLVEKKSIDGRSNCYMITQKGAVLVKEHREMVEKQTENIE